MAHFRKNYSKYNEKCLLLEFPIPKSKLFFIFLLKNARNDSEILQPISDLTPKLKNVLILL